MYRLEEAFSAFDSERFGAQIESSFPVNNRLRFGLFYDYRVVELEAEDPLDLDTLAGGILDRELVDTEVSSLTATILYDRRNDPVDPSSGWSSTLQLERAFPFLDAEERFIKLFGQVTSYLPLGRFGALGASLRYGAIEPDGALPTSMEIMQSAPISERFFAGGRTSHRAYRRDRLGIPGETVIEGIEIGGEGMALVNLDYRFPLVGPVGDRCDPAEAGQSSIDEDTLVPPVGIAGRIRDQRIVRSVLPQVLVPEGDIDATNLW